MLTSGWKLRHQWFRNGAPPPVFSIHSSSFCPFWGVGGGELCGSEEKQLKGTV